MPDFCKRRLSRKTAIVLAVLAMWIVGGVGLGLMHSAYHWWFLGLGGYDAVTVGQIGGYYLARAGAQTPSIAFVALIIGISQFRRPVRAACLTAFAFHGIGTVIRLVRNPWSVAPNLNQSIPVLAELGQLIWMVALTGFSTWLFIRLASWLEAIRALRHFRQMPKPK
jgi:hypothetical protein